MGEIANVGRKKSHWIKKIALNKKINEKKNTPSKRNRYWSIVSWQNWCDTTTHKSQDSDKVGLYRVSFPRSWPLWLSTDYKFNITVHIHTQEAFTLLSNTSKITSNKTVVKEFLSLKGLGKKVKYCTEGSKVKFLVCVKKLVKFELWTRNSKVGIQNLEVKTWNSKLESQNLEVKTRNSNIWALNYIHLNSMFSTPSSRPLYPIHAWCCQLLIPLRKKY